MSLILANGNLFNTTALQWQPGSRFVRKSDPIMDPNDPPFAIDDQPFRVTIADTSRYYGAAANSHPVNLPRAEVGQWMFVLFQLETAVTVFSSGPSGWALGSINTGGGGKFTVAKKKADGSEGATGTFNFNASTECAAVGFTLVNWSGSIDNYVWDTTGTSATPDPSNAVFPELGPYNVRRLLVEWAGWANDTFTLNNVTPGYSKIADVGGDGTTTSVHLVVAFKEAGSAAQQNPAAMSISGSTAWNAGTFGFVPVQFHAPVNFTRSHGLLGAPVLQQPANAGWWPMIGKDNAAIPVGTFLATATSYVLTLPGSAGSLSGVRVIGSIHMNGETAAPTLPGGWTQIAFTSDATPFGLCSFYRDCDGTEGATITITNASGVNHTAAWILIPFTKCDPSAPPEFASSNGNTNNPDAASVSPSWGTARKSVAIAFESNLTLGINTGPSNMGQHEGQVSVTNARIAYSTQLFLAGSFDPATYDLTGSGSTPWLCHTIAVKGRNNAVSYTLPVGQGSYNLNGQTVNLLFGRKVQANQGSYNLNGQTVGLLWKHNMPVVPGAYALTGPTTNLLWKHVMPVTQGSYALNGQTVNLLQGKRLIAIQGSYNLNGQTVALSRGRIMAMGGGSYALNGQTVNLLRGRRLIANQGAYNLNGQSVVLLWKHNMPVVQGLYNLNGQNVGLNKGRTLAVGQGSYNLNGQTVNLLWKHVMPVAQGSYNLNGQAIVMTKGRTLVAVQGSYNLNGQTVNLLRKPRLIANQGSYNLNGQTVGLLRGRTLAVGQGSYSLNGQIVGLLRKRVLQAQQGSYLLTGLDVSLLFQGNRPPLLAAPGSYAINGQSANLRAQRRLSAEPGAYLLAGQAAQLVWKNFDMEMLGRRAAADERAGPAYAAERAAVVNDERSGTLADERNANTAPERNDGNAD